MKTSDFDYNLPIDYIAQTPIEPRDHSRLLVLDRNNGSLGHRQFYEIDDYLHEGDVLVFNDSRVIRARLRARKAVTGGRAEILLLRKYDSDVWEVLVKSHSKLKVGAEFVIAADDYNSVRAITAEVTGVGEDGVYTIAFSDDPLLAAAGEVPLPPYIHTPLKDPERYQTVYAREPGSVAAPTAGLHFTPELVEKIRQKGIECLFITLHVGLDTFRPVREENPRKHRIHKEYGIISTETARELTRARGEGRRIVCAGTTTMRLLEAAAQESDADTISKFAGLVSLFILPGYHFRMVDRLITNFHLPKSTLLMLVSAFAGKERIDEAYREAVKCGYRFYSFGDAMLIL